MGFILKSRLEYSVEKLLSDIIISVFKADINLVFGNRTRYREDGSFKAVEMTISKYPLYKDNSETFNFWIESIEEKHIEYKDTEFDWVEKDKKLHNIAYIDNVRDYEELAFKFVYEYLKLNPNDYFWFEDDYAFNFEDMERLSKLPFDSNWCYKNPKNL